MSQKLEEFLGSIQNHKAAAFSSTAQEIASLSPNDQRSLAVLSDLILQDPAMTLHVLREANSAYRVRKGKTNTVSRAIVMLGFDTVRTICLSCALLDGIMGGTPRDELVKEMARTFHAATQARYLALNRGALRTEETFTATLLDKFGAMVFWSYGGELADKLEKAVECSDKGQEEIEQEVLGFTLVEFSEALADAWGFADAVHYGSEADPGAQIKRSEISLCQNLSRATHAGWDSPKVESIIDQMKVASGLSQEALHSVLHVAAKEAATTASSFGAAAASQMIPVPDFNNLEEDPLVMGEQTVEEFEQLDPDPMVQLQVLQDISSLMEAGGDVTLLISTVLEGLRRGLGLDRVLFAMTNDRRNQLTAKLILGADQGELLEKFHFEIPQTDSSIFYQLFENNRSFWMTSEREARAAGYDISELQKAVGDMSFMLGPTVVDEKPIGVFYADMKTSGREIDRKTFQSFKQLALQASVAIKHIEENF